jgi:hypothetical protein
MMENRCDEKNQRMDDKVDMIERNLTIQVDKANRAVDQLKLDLFEALEQKYDIINQMFETELTKVRDRYDDIIRRVREAGVALNDNFVKKVKKIKEKSAVFFAKLEMKLNENNQEVVAISNMFRAWQETIQGPTQKFDA